MTTVALSSTPAERSRLTLALCYSLALHILLIALLGVLAVQNALHSPAQLEMVVVGLVPVAQVNLGQTMPLSSTPLRNPQATDQSLSAPQTAAQSALAEARPRTTETVTPPIISIASPEPFYVPTSDRASSQFASRQQNVSERRTGQPVATAPMRGTGANLPEHALPQISATLPTTQGPVTPPPFIPSAVPVTSVVHNPDGATPQGSTDIGIITSSRALLEKELPPVPEEIQRSGVEPVFCYKVLINPAGDIIEATVHKRSSYPRYEEKVRETILAKWRYARGVGYEWRIINLSVDLR